MAVVNKHSSHSRDFKLRVLTCLNKLSDRDTHSAAATELESIAKTLSHDSIPPFLSSITATDSSDKLPVRKQCVRLISVLSESHGNSLSPYLSKLLSSVIRRFRDSDSAVRSSCVSAITSISSHITKPPFTSIAKPLIEALVTEQDLNCQIGAALCLAAAIDGSPDPEPAFLKRLVPRLEKLLRSECFKAKAALLTVFGSVIGADGSLNQQSVRNVVKCLVDFVSSEDWAARKAAAEALAKLAVVERSVLPEYKASCLKTFEAKRFDKVKVVRDTMNLMLDAWKEIPDVSDEVSLPPVSQYPTREIAVDGRYPPSSKASSTDSSEAPQLMNSISLAKGCPLRDGSYTSNACKRSPLNFSVQKTGPAMFRKLDRKKPATLKVETVNPPPAVDSGDNKERDERVFYKEEGQKNRFTNHEMRLTPFTKNTGEKIEEFVADKAGLHMISYHDEMSGSMAVAGKITEDLYNNQKECEDLSLIHKQLLQIEKQQSGLLDLLEGFIQSSQNGMRSLESRVYGLELTLDEISLDLAVSTGKMPNVDSARSNCWKLPGAEYISSKLLRKTEGRQLSSRYHASGGSSSAVALHNMTDKIGDADTYKLESRRLWLHSGGGFIVNPLAEVHSNSRGISHASSDRASKNDHGAI